MLLFVTAGQMGKDGTDIKGLLIAKCGNNAVDVWLHKAQTVHASIQLDVDRVAGLSVASCRLGKSFQR